jgi:hypothetical protein
MREEEFMDVRTAFEKIIGRDDAFLYIAMKIAECKDNETRMKIFQELAQYVCADEKSAHKDNSSIH